MRSMATAMQGRSKKKSPLLLKTVVVEKVALTKVVKIEVAKIAKVVKIATYRF